MVKFLLIRLVSGVLLEEKAIYLFFSIRIQKGRF